MYLRHDTQRKNGKVHTYWRLMRSVRMGRKVRQEQVAWLGELDEAARVKARELAQRITGREQPGQLALFEPPLDETVRIRIQGVHVKRQRIFGDVWLAWVLFTALRLDELFVRLIAAGGEEVAWWRVLATLVIARFCEPSSELRIAEQWFRKTALDDLLSIPAEKVNYDRLYRGLDVLLPFKQEVETHLKERLGELFELSYEIMLYDVTSSYFEGEEKGNLLARRGHSRDSRRDCKQVIVALVATHEGMPLAHEVFAGNTSDVKTVRQIVAGIEEKFGKASRVWILDRGMVSAEVLAWFRAGKRAYIVGTPRSELKNFEAAVLSKRDWIHIREDLEVKHCPSPDGQETFILCRSEARRAKEQALHQRFAERIEAGLKKLQGRLQKAKKPEDRGRAERQVGRLLQRNSRAARLFEVQVLDSQTNLCGTEICWTRNSKHTEWASLSEGCYLLRASQLDWTPEQLWRAYVQLTDVEEAFRIQKTELQIRPIRHQTEDRTRAHIFVCFIAYAMWKTLEQWSQRAGLGKSPRKLLEEFRAIESMDVVLPTSEAYTLRLRCVGQPEPALAILLERLGLKIPQSLQLPKHIEDGHVGEM